MKKRTQHMVACTNEYIGLDPANPEATSVGQLNYFPLEYFDDCGNLLPKHQSNTMSYSAVGSAVITVEFYSAKRMLEAKIAALKTQKIQVQADAQATLVSIEQKIQSLLAISFDQAQP